MEPIMENPRFSDAAMGNSPQFFEGDAPWYYSTTHHEWTQTEVQKVHPDGTLTIAAKRPRKPVTSDMTMEEQRRKLRKTKPDAWSPAQYIHLGQQDEDDLEHHFEEVPFLRGERSVNIAVDKLNMGDRTIRGDFCTVRSETTQQYSYLLHYSTQTGEQALEVFVRAQKRANRSSKAKLDEVCAELADTKESESAVKAKLDVVDKEAKQQLLTTHVLKDALDKAEAKTQTLQDRCVAEASATELRIAGMKKRHGDELTEINASKNRQEQIAGQKNSELGEITQQLQTRLESLDGERDLLTKDNTVLQQSLQESKLDNTVLQQSLQESKHDSTVLQQSMQESKQNLADCIAELQDSKDSEVRLKEHMSQEIDERERRIASLETDLERERNELITKNTTSQALERDLEACKDCVAILEKDKASLVASADQVRLDADEQRRIVVALEHKLEERDQRIVGMEGEQVQAESLVVATRKERHDLARNNSTLQQDLNSKEQSIVSLEDRLEQSRSELIVRKEVMSEECSQLGARVFELERELAACKQSTASLEKDKEMLQTLVVELQDHISVHLRSVGKDDKQLEQRGEHLTTSPDPAPPLPRKQSQQVTSPPLLSSPLPLLPAPPPPPKEKKQQHLQATDFSSIKSELASPRSVSAVSDFYCSIGVQDEEVISPIINETAMAEVEDVEETMRAAEEAQLQAECEAKRKAEEKMAIEEGVHARMQAKVEAIKKERAEAREAQVKADEEDAKLKAEEEAREAQLNAEEEARLQADMEAKASKVEEEVRLKAKEELLPQAEFQARDCHNCGVVNEEDAKFCGSCGERLKDSSEMVEIHQKIRLIEAAMA